MTLPYRQERHLRRADHALRRSDPDLASMLSIFARLTAAEGMPAREQLRPRQTWASRVLLWPVAAAGGKQQLTLSPRNFFLGMSGLKCDPGQHIATLDRSRSRSLPPLAALP
jgi:hypothetical protein